MSAVDMSAVLQASEAPALALHDSTRVVSYDPSRPSGYGVVNRVFGAVVDPGVIRTAWTTRRKGRRTMSRAARRP
jgi:hypothetical protein